MWISTNTFALLEFWSMASRQPSKCARSFYNSALNRKILEGQICIRKADTHVQLAALNVKDVDQQLHTAEDVIALAFKVVFVERVLTIETRQRQQ